MVYKLVVFENEQLYTNIFNTIDANQDGLISGNKEIKKLERANLGPEFAVEKGIDGFVYVNGLDNSKAKSGIRLGMAQYAPDDGVTLPLVQINPDDRGLAYVEIEQGQTFVDDDRQAVLPVIVFTDPQTGRRLTGYYVGSKDNYGVVESALIPGSAHAILVGAEVYSESEYEDPKRFQERNLVITIKQDGGLDVKTGKDAVAAARGVASDDDLKKIERDLNVTFGNPIDARGQREYELYRDDKGTGVYREGRALGNINHGGEFGRNLTPAEITERVGELIGREYPEEAVKKALIEKRYGVSLKQLAKEEGRAVYEVEIDGKVIGCVYAKGTSFGLNELDEAVRSLLEKMLSQEVQVTQAALAVFVANKAVYRGGHLVVTKNGAGVLELPWFDIPLMGNEEEGFLTRVVVDAVPGDPNRTTWTYYNAKTGQSCTRTDDWNWQMIISTECE